MYTIIKLYMAICLCGFIDASDLSIKWDVKTKSVIYGEDTSLTCNGHTCSPHSSKQWIGGPSYDLLCSEEYTANQYKYEMVVQSTSFYFDLMIKNFTFDDADCKYTCVCGLHQYTKMLELDSLDFIYPPYLEKENLVTKESEVEVDILMKVYPLPKCTISYQEMVIQVNITDLTTTNEHGGHFKLYKARIQHRFAMDHLGCKGILNLSCTVGLANYTLIEKTIDLCNEDQNDLLHLGLAIGISVLLCVIITCCIRKFVKRKHKETTVPVECELLPTSLPLLLKSDEGFSLAKNGEG